MFVSNTIYRLSAFKYQLLNEVIGIKYNYRQKIDYVFKNFNIREKVHKYYLDLTIAITFRT